MVIEHFLPWADQASAGARAEGISALARAYLYADLDPVEQGEAEHAMTALLDDPSPLVRRALAEALAGAVHAPHHIIVALASDQSEIAALVLARSSLLGDAELIDAVAIADGLGQRAVAARPALSAAVAGAVAEIGSREAVLTLCGNAAAAVGDFSARRILERFGDDGEVRESLGCRKDLGPGVRHALVVATAEALKAFVTRCEWMGPERAKRVMADARDRATMSIASESGRRDGDEGHRRFAAYLRDAGALTPALLLRALLSRQTALFEAGLCELTGKSPARVAGLVRNWVGLGFEALYGNAGLPHTLLPVFRAALQANAAASGATADEHVGLKRRMVERVRAACATVDGEALGSLMALLRRFEAEAAREEVRLAARSDARRGGAEVSRGSGTDARSARLRDLRVAA